jgi:hypothetical protein
MSQDYAALSEVWCAQAKKCVRAAHHSNNLHDIVRLVAMAATLERCAVRLSSKTAVSVTTATTLAQEGARLCGDAQLMIQQLPSTRSCSEEFSAVSQTDVNALVTRRGPLVNLRKGGAGTMERNARAVDLFFNKHGVKL